MNRPRTIALAVLVSAAAACTAPGGGRTADDELGRGPGTANPSAQLPADAAAPVSASRVDPRLDGLELGFGEFAITLEADEIRPGPVTFVVRNGGELIHGFEIEIEESGDSSGHGHGGSGDRFKFEGPEFGPGDTVEIPANLAPGVYEIECFVAEHDDLGMRTTLVVRPGAPLIRPEGGAGEPDRVEIRDFAFAPIRTEVPPGTEVTWSNVDPAAHTVTARDGSFDSGTLDPRSEFTAVFDDAGTFEYFCQIHPSMRGVVRVVEQT